MRAKIPEGSLRSRVVSELPCGGSAGGICDRASITEGSLRSLDLRREGSLRSLTDGISQGMQAVLPSMRAAKSAVAFTFAQFRSQVPSGTRPPVLRMDSSVE